VLVNVKLLIDAIMRQTTVLIAQLSTAAGVRAPLADVADQVFLSLSREIEAQGVGRKVVADMFGLALRGYQKKTQRLATSSSVQGKTLFEAVLEFVEKESGAQRSTLLKRFERDGERETTGVLADLVQSGLLYASGSGESTFYGITSDAERQRYTRQSDTVGLANMALGAIYRSPGVSREALAVELRVARSELELALALLERDGRISCDPLTMALSAKTFQIDMDEAHGWESAVFDHFQALVTAITSKLHLRSRLDPAAQWVGGTTLRFELTPQHPLRQEVLQLLAQIRLQTDRLWERVAEHNTLHPSNEDERFNVSFYFGQNIDDTALATHSMSDDGEHTP
jgi:hypothetical protein